MTVRAKRPTSRQRSRKRIGTQPDLFNPVFPPPAGVEEPLDFPQAHGCQPSIWRQPAFAWQTTHCTTTSAYGQQLWASGQVGNSSPRG